jgi:hypothetical protein
MTVWAYQNGPVTIGVERDALAYILNASFASVINQVAESVAQEARNVLPHPTMKRAIGVKRAGVVESGNKGRWRLDLKGRRYASGAGARLMRGVEVPVALVTNDSNLAMTWEYGYPPRKLSEVFRRKDGSRPRTGRSGGGTPVYGPEYYRRYQPLTLGAQRAGARLVLKYRPPR